MRSPAYVFQIIYRKIRHEWKIAFLTCFFAGLFIHMPILVSDIPNHDGLGSMYFDQNMITSGRWFLTIACGFSSYYSLPWLTGILGLVFLSFTAAALCELLEVRKTWAVMLCSVLLAAFPALASSFAYVYTLDGYMMALLLSVLSVLFTKKYRRGFIPGAVCLAFSLGIYQAYLSFAMILSLFSIIMLLGQEENRSGQKKTAGHLKQTICRILHYLYMGILGGVLYLVILQLLLKLQGKVLDTYQGIDGLALGSGDGEGIFSIVVQMYRDFLDFSLKGNILFQNLFSLAACIVLACLMAVVIILLGRNRKWWKNPFLFAIMILAVLVLPVATNIILLVSPGVNYHLLMRYQWVLYLIGAAALVSRCETGDKRNAWLEWSCLCAAFVLVLCYWITDNVAYANLQKRYEKTYAYCVRLLDRIEQTQGYYPGIPIAMIGVVGDEQYPVTDITLPVTGGMIGMNGDSLLYTGENYRAFMQHFLGATLNILPPEAMKEMYYSDEYKDMDSFPGKNSVRIIEGILYIKTENVTR